MPADSLRPTSRSTMFGGYEFVSRIAVGGMAEIFLAREDGGRPDEFLVIKRLLPHVAQHPDLVQMFLDEARVAATLDHPNIVNIYNVGAIGDQYFLSMDYCLGLDLAKVCDRLWRRSKTLPLELTIYLLMSVLEALKYAHTKSGTDGKPLHIVHRDVSPHNIFVTYDGEVKLLDFGVAKAANALHHTKTGALVGKVAYMSPEQCRVDKIDCRSDLFSLGIVMYELTTGRRLYNSKKLGDFEVLRQICEEPVPRPSEVRPNYPIIVEQIVLQALAKKPEDRLQDADQFQEQLRKACKMLGFNATKDTMRDFLKREFAEEIAGSEALIERLQEQAPNDELMSWGSIEELGMGVVDKSPRRETAPPPDSVSPVNMSAGMGAGMAVSASGMVITHDTPSINNRLVPETVDSDDGFDSEADQTQRLSRASGSGKRQVEWKAPPMPPSVQVNEAPAANASSGLTPQLIALAIGVALALIAVILLWLM